MSPAFRRSWNTIIGLSPATLPADPTDIKAILDVVVEVERCAVRGYTQLCDLTAGKDYRTYDLWLSILNEEIEHESWFAEFLGRVPPAIACAGRGLALRLEIPEVGSRSTAETPWDLADERAPSSRER